MGGGQAVVIAVHLAGQVEQRLAGVPGPGRDVDPRTVVAAMIWWFSIIAHGMYDTT